MRERDWSDATSAVTIGKRQTTTWICPAMRGKQRSVDSLDNLGANIQATPQDEIIRAVRNLSN